MRKTLIIGGLILFALAPLCREKKDNIIYIETGGFGNLFHNYLDNQYGHFRKLRTALSKLGYEIAQTKNLDMLTRVAAIICFDVPKDQLHLLKQYNKEKNILFLWEPPTTKSFNYNQAYHAPFSKVYTLLDNLVDNKTYFKFYEPQPTFEMIHKPVPFQNKKLCTLLTKNTKRGHSLSTTGERKKIVDFFNSLKDDAVFDLYGHNWSKKDSPYYRGIARFRPACFRNYKFVFCYDNAKNTRGYITAHKIFFPMIAGSIPIRFARANSIGYIPNNCFISKEDFDSYEQLYEYLAHMPEETYNQYLKNIKQYLNSKEALVFSSTYFVHIFISSFLPNYNKDIVFSKEEQELIAFLDNTFIS